MNKISLFKVFFSIVFSLFILNNCSKVRESAGVNRKVPDEYTITTEPTLALPPDYQLIPPEEMSKKNSNNDENLTKEILFGLDEESEIENNLKASSALDSILYKSGATTASNSIREEVELLNLYTKSFKGVFAGEKYMTEEEILDAAKESERIRNNIFNNKSITEGEIPITTRPKKRKSFFGNLL